MDTAQSRHFFGNAWRSLASTRNLFGKLCLVALIQFVPVLGQIVALGYFLGWAREAAWNMQTPLPPHVFGRDDETFWARGALGFVVCLLYGFIQAIAAGLLVALGAVIAASFGLTGTSLAILTCVLCVVGLLLFLLLSAFEVVGLVRMAIYTSFGAAFQWGVCCTMIGREFGGLFKLFWTAVLAGIVVSVACLVAAVALVPAAAGVGVGIPLVSAVVSYGDFTDAGAALLAGVLGASALLSVAFVVVDFFLMVPSLMVQALLWRALGSWVALFDVASWGGRHEGLPAAGAAAADAQEGAQPAASAPELPAERRCHPLLVGLGSAGLCLLVSLVCSGCVAAIASALYSSGAVQIDVREATQVLREAADDMLDEWDSTVRDWNDWRTW